MSSSGAITWWYDESEVPTKVEDLYVVRLTVQPDGRAELRFEDGTNKHFPSASDAELWLTNEEFRQIDMLSREGVIPPEFRAAIKQKIAAMTK